MFARIEVALRPEFKDSNAENFLRQLELSYPELRKKVRWLRWVDVFWLDLPISREELILAVGEVFWDPVLKWVFTGNLIPSAAGKVGGLPDLMAVAPHRPGKFYGIERRFRSGVVDTLARTTREAFELVLKRALPGARVTTGTLIVVEGPQLTEADLSVLATGVFCNELLESWTLLLEEELVHSERFQQERIRMDLPRILLKSSLKQPASTSKKSHLFAADSDPKRLAVELKKALSDQHGLKKIQEASVRYKADGVQGRGEIPESIQGVFSSTVQYATDQSPKSWILSVFKDHAGIVAFDEEYALVLKAEAQSVSIQHDSFGGSLTAHEGVIRDILATGQGAMPLFQTQTYCVGDLEKPSERKVWTGMTKGSEVATQYFGVTGLNGAVVVDSAYERAPALFCGGAGWMPRTILEKRAEMKDAHSGDLLLLLGGRTGREGMEHFSLTEFVQRGDALILKRVQDLLLEARNLGLLGATCDLGRGGLALAAYEMSRLTHGLSLDLSAVPLHYSNMIDWEILISESQERILVSVPKSKVFELQSLAERRNVEATAVGVFNNSGQFEVFFEKELRAQVSLQDQTLELNQAVVLEAQWSGVNESVQTLPEALVGSYFEHQAPLFLLGLLNRPAIASKQSIVERLDQEVQGISVIKPFHQVGVGKDSQRGPNDASVIKPRFDQYLGLAVGTGIAKRRDPFLAAQASADEAIRNILSVGCEFGLPESFVALMDSAVWPSVENNPDACARWVRMAYGLRAVGLALGTPFVSGKSEFQDTHSGVRTPETVCVTAVGRVADVRLARSSDFKSPGDWIYYLGLNGLGLVDSELERMLCAQSETRLPSLRKSGPRVGEPDWVRAFNQYAWLGGTRGKESVRLRSVHDVSEGGLLVAVAECLMARNYGARIRVPEAWDPWEFCFGEGFHGFILSCAEHDNQNLELEWMSLGIDFVKIGQVQMQDCLEVESTSSAPEAKKLQFKVLGPQMRKAWTKEGYWR